MKKITLRDIFSAICIGSTAFSAPVAFSQTAMFSVKALPSLPGETQGSAYGINNDGDVVGSVGGLSGCPNGCAVVWSDGTPTLLGAVPGTTSTAAISINNAGQISGTAVIGQGTDTTTAIIWNGGVASILPGGAHNNESQANFINDSGQVVGSAASSAIEWNGTTPTQLGLAGNTFGAAWGINNNGLIVGEIRNTPVVWHGTIPTQLPTISGGGGGKAFAINSVGLVVGTASTPASSGGYAHGAAWTNGVVTDLGALNTSSAAAAVNTQGVIVGKAQTQSAGLHAVFWSGTGSPIQDLNSLISTTAASQIILTSASAINDNCTIVAQGYARKTKLYQPLVLVLNGQFKCTSGMQ